MKSFLFTLFSFLLCFVVFTGCGQEEDLSQNSYDQVEVVPKYSLSVADTVFFNALSNKLCLTVTSLDDSNAIILDWDHLVSNTYNADLGSDPWMAYGPNLKNTFTKEELSKSVVEDDWLTYQLIEEDGVQKILISLEDNNTGEIRGKRIYIYKKLSNNYYGMGQCIIFQYPEDYLVKVRYKGKKYESYANADLWGNVTYKDQGMSELIDMLSAKEDVETIVMDNEEVLFFDKEDVQTNYKVKDLINEIDNSCYCQELANSQVNNVGDDRMSRLSYDPFAWNDPDNYGYYAVFEDSEFRGYKNYYNFIGLMIYLDLYDLSEHNLQDKISSLAVAYNYTDPTICSVLVLWENEHWNYNDSNRSKHRISFVASYDNPQISRNKLSTIPCLNGGNWNDKASSLSFYFGNYDNYWADY